jgi:hypothetical protein
LQTVADGVEEGCFDLPGTVAGRIDVIAPVFSAVRVDASVDTLVPRYWSADVALARVFSEAARKWLVTGKKKSSFWWHPSYP